MVAVGRVGSKYFAQVNGGTTDMYRMYRPAYTRKRSLEMSTINNEETFRYEIPGNNEPSERSRYLTSIGEGEEDDANKDFVRERIQKAAKAGGLAWEPARKLP